jgi:hypothetical protein
MPSRVTIAGVKVAVAPGDRPVADSVTGPAKPSTIPSKSGKTAVPPGRTVCVGGVEPDPVLDVMVKLAVTGGAPDPTTKVAVWVPAA